MDGVDSLFGPICVCVALHNQRLLLEDLHVLSGTDPFLSQVLGFEQQACEGGERQRKPLCIWGWLHATCPVFLASPWLYLLVC